MKNELCPWCHATATKKPNITRLDFTIIDDDFGQPVSFKLIRFCPFCGREFSKTEKDKNP